MSLLKVREADYFLGLLRQSGHDQSVAHYHANAFLSAWAAIPEVLRTECQAEPRFKLWVQAKTVRIEALAPVRELKAFRNHALHNRSQRPLVEVVAVFSEDRTGQATMGWVPFLVGLGGKRFENALEKCQQALDAYEGLVCAAFTEGLLRLPKEGAGHSIAFRARKQDEDGSWKEVKLKTLHNFQFLEQLSSQMEAPPPENLADFFHPMKEFREAEKERLARQQPATST